MAYNGFAQLRGFVSHLSLLVAIKFPCLLTETVIEIVGYISTWSKEGAGERGRGREGGEGGGRGQEEKYDGTTSIVQCVEGERERKRERRGSNRSY